MRKIQKKLGFTEFDSFKGYRQTAYTLPTTTEAIAPKKELPLRLFTKDDPKKKK